MEVSNDGLYMSEVGRWSKRKYHFLSNYLNMFSTGMKNKWPQRHYVDLFSGAGLARLRDQGEIVVGSPLIAARVRDPFTKLHLCEADPKKFEALKQRISREPLATPPQLVHGDANRCIDEIVADIPPAGALTLVFADPYGLHFDFDTVRKLADRKCDLIVLLADNMDALRNWSAYYQHDPNSNLDRFMGEPGWRDVLKESPSERLAQNLRDRYCDRLRSQGFQFFGWERVVNDRNRDIYTLLFASSNKRGLDFWGKASATDEGGQRRLF
jgi:three-Cys-motif partner protein